MDSAEGDEAEGSRLGIAVLGAGPAGLTAAYILARRGVRAVVFEADAQVGGIARTVEHDGYRFDLGGHRFFTKLKPLQQLWETVLGDEFLVRPRLSRIYYHGKFFAYPLEAKDVVRRLGPLESIRCTLSYLRAQLFARRRPQETFENWVEARFGRRLYDAFFGPYTEKVWGISGSEIRAEWAAQRIRNFSFWQAVLALLGRKREHVTTLIEQFHYPRLGPGQMWEAFRQVVEAGGVPVELERRCTAIFHEHGLVTGIEISGPDGAPQVHPVDAVLSSLPLSELVLHLEPFAPPEVRTAAERLRYRELVLVALMLDDHEPFPDNWIYLHDPGVRAGRVQNFGAWSPALVRPGTTCLGVEYFCFAGDDLWNLSEADAIALATTELASIGLVDPERVTGGARVRVPRAYPMYDGDYNDAVLTLKGYLAGFDNLKTFGRNGLHRYNNQDHSMWTAALATLNLLDGATHDVWSVNTEDVYLEDAGAVVSAFAEIDLVGAVGVVEPGTGAAGVVGAPGTGGT